MSDDLKKDLEQGIADDKAGAKHVKIVGLTVACALLGLVLVPAVEWVKVWWRHFFPR
jgi:hypothetical protein